MYEEIVDLERDLTRILDRYRDVPLAIRSGVLLNLILVIQLHTEAVQKMIEPVVTEPVGGDFVKVEADPDDDGPAMTLVEKNLEND